MKPEAEDILRALGERVTRSRVSVLSTLLSTQEALSHHDVESRLRSEHLDRVTVYRVLDWLVIKGLSHRMIGPDRVQRFMAERPGHEKHAHFHCSGCGKTLCLDALPATTVGLPCGFRARELELTVHGLCPKCS